MYVALKCLHVIAIISWMAGLLYLWRLYVYHAQETEQVVKDRLMIMERRLLRAIATPAGVVAVTTGLSMLYFQSLFFDQLWMRIKLACVLLLIFNHVLAIRYRHRLARGEAFRHRRFRFLNEMPTLLMVVIVIMVIAKPF